MHTFSFSAKIQDGRQKWRKSKFYPFAQDTLVLPCGSKIRSKSLYLLRFSRYSHFFHLLQNSKMATKSGENSNFTPLHRTLLHYHAGQKFARNRSISYGFRDIHTFFIFRKNLRWLPKVAKIEIFRLSTGHSCTTLQVKNSLEIAVSVTVFEIFTLFHFPQKSKMTAKTGEN